MGRTYPSKLLLFGEYTVLSGSQALAVPFNQKRGEWILTEDPEPGHHSLQEYIKWLRERDLLVDTAAEKIKADFEAGWKYQADIPVGYGLGSSGALVAAIYDRYMAKPKEETNESVLETLAKMESYFHGSSSGMDPMVSFTQQALYKDDMGQFQSIQDPGWPEDFKVYLLDSGVARETGPMVNQYKQLLEKEEYKLLVERELIPMVEHAMHFYLNGSAHMLEECLSVISHFQRTYFETLIPDQMKTQWDELTAMDGIYLKFCGAGGGGYFFVISTGKELEIKDDTLIRIH